MPNSQEPSYQPIIIADGDRRMQPTAVEKVCVFFPFVGWIIGAHIENRRQQHLHDEVVSQLQNRTFFPSHDWTIACPHFSLDTITRFCEIIKEVCSLPNHHLLPSDPVCYVFIGSDLEWFVSDISQKLNNCYEIIDFRISYYIYNGDLSQLLTETLYCNPH